MINLYVSLMCFAVMRNKLVIKVADRWTDGRTGGRMRLVTTIGIAKILAET